MSQPVIQASFNSGEWAPALYARVDLAKYHSGAALLRNFFVDYRGGATTRPGSKYVSWTLGNGVARLIPFQASLGVTYALEFGQNYVRFYNNGAAIVESPVTITGATQANPGVITAPTHGYSNGQRVFISNVVGMTQLNGNYYDIANVTTNTFTLVDQFGTAVNTTTFGAYTSGGIVQRVYTISSPYLSSEVFAIKYAQDINILILCHPNHPPYQLILNTTTNWTLTAVNFGPTIATPGILTLTSSATSGNNNVSYIMTAVDVNGQESATSSVASIGTSTLACTNTLTWTTVAGAVSYNIYKTTVNLTTAPPAGSQFGFIANVTGTAFGETNIVPDFAQGPPVAQSPFSGSSIQSLTLTNQGAGYIADPIVTIAPPPSGVTAQATCNLFASSISIASGGNGYNVGDTILGQAGIGLTVTSAPFGVITGFSTITRGNVNPGGSAPGSPSPTTGGSGIGCTLNTTWSVYNLQLTNPGSGYITPPAISFFTGSGGGAAAVAVLGAQSSGNPTVPSFVEQRMFLGGPVLSPAQFNLSQPGAIYDFNTTFPVAADNAIQATLTSTTLNAIKSATPVSAGLLILTDKGAWLVNGGSNGAPFSATQLVANPQAFSGASDLPPIVTPQDILYNQSKGSIVRDLAYNFYLANYVGTDISILSSHLFYSFSLIQWAWAEEPFKVIWAVRNDGVMLTLTFLKEQELIAWAHSDTNGLYKSVADVNEPTSIGNVDAIYTIVQRIINGQTVNYIERFVELTYPNNYISSWQVDAGIGYTSASPATTFSGANHLSGQACTGLADGVVINFTMPVGGIFQFGLGGTPGLTGIPSASTVTVGLAFTPTLTTLPLDLGEPTVAGKRKKISGVSLKVTNALGLSMCSGTAANLANAQPLPDLIIGNINPYNNAIITGLVTGDARGYLDPDWSIPGQYTITQPNPYPASVLGVVPEIEVGDTPK